MMGHGRPTKLTPEIADAIEQVVRAGACVGVAARRLGISAEAAEEWVRRGEGRSERRATEPYVSFATRIRKAEADDEVRRIALIAKAGTGGEVTYRRTTTKADGAVVMEERLLAPEWTANAWHLERKHPERWGRKERHEITGKDGGPIDARVIFYLPEPTRRVAVLETPSSRVLPPAGPEGNGGDPNRGEQE